MRRALPLAFAVLIQGSAFGQQTPSSLASEAGATKPAPEDVVYAGPGLTAPELIPAKAPTFRNWPCTSIDGTVAVGAVVYANGIPRDIHILRTKMADLDTLAMQIVTADRFKPGAYKNESAEVAVSVDVTMETCVKGSRPADGGEVLVPQLRKQPVQKVNVLPAPPQKGASASDISAPGGHISPPVPLHTVEPEYSDYGRKKRLRGFCLVQAVIDVNGIPYDVRVVKSLEPSMDEKAVEAVKQFRFKPAMRDGTVPVPVRITIQVNFRIGKRTWRF